MHLFPPFADDALCAQTDPELFFPEKGSTGGKVAKSVCSQCPVRTECLEWALLHGEDGIWGGTSPLERRQLRKARAMEAGDACGTLPGYDAHVAAGETPCARCRGAKGHETRAAA